MTPLPARSTVTRFTIVLLLLLALAGIPVAAAANPTWAPASQATVHPGVMTFTDGTGQCTANFVFVDDTDVYLGQAAHCAGLGSASDTNGCLADSLPLDTKVEILGADHPGTLAYSSWIAMQQAGETDFNTCQFNDFALVRVDPRDHGKVNPSIPYWGGPIGLNRSGTGTFERVYTYGNSSLRLGLSPLSPKNGYSLGTTAQGWNHPVYTVTPGIPGDSGSAFLDADGRATGVLATLAIAPIAGSNGVTDLARALDYAAARGMEVELAQGTEPFRPGLLPLLL